MSIKTLCNVELEGGSRIIGQTIVLGSASGLINRTASQLASDGTDWYTLVVIITVGMMRETGQHKQLIL